MTRPIKFRAWDDQTKTMLSDVCYMNTGHGYGNYSVVLPFKSENYYKCHGQSGWEIDHAHNAYKHNLKVMQFTGLRDRGGAEIYESDIVKFKGKDDSIGHVHWQEFACAFVIDWSHGEYPSDDPDRLPVQIWHHLELVVIGNIYENKDLL